ncbi:hypothetical protein [Methanobrevibacter sp.]|uniref:hypothetical protein n=1 Tax=Methanobrevibacter sp. TaxID=66852 RepID=UPI0025E50749|nr:hypothetical protein [Methanobrevibacter sp.]MBQ2665234.1 hypothetical protein [Methanobrevibacter sp.]
MRIKSNIQIEDISRLIEIAEIYSITNQKEKSKEYLEIAVKICEKFPKNEEMLQFKIHSLNLLNKPYKSLETTNELLNLNPYNFSALINIAAYLRGH